MKIQSVKIEEKPLAVLRGIARTEKRSIGFLIREAITFWLARRKRQTGK
jgi:hypothetical protein